MFVFVNTSPVPVVVSIVFVVTLVVTVPLEMALKPVFVVESMSKPPVKLNVAPGLLNSETPSPGSVIAPPNATVPPVWLVTSMDRPAAVVATVPL